MEITDVESTDMEITDMEIRCREFGSAAMGHVGIFWTVVTVADRSACRQKMICLRSNGGRGLQGFAGQQKIRVVIDSLAVDLVFVTENLLPMPLQHDLAARLP